VSKSSKRGRSQFDQALGPESATVDGKIGEWSVPLTTSGEGGRVVNDFGGGWSRVVHED
jgi:hypothetical protein